MECHQLLRKSWNAKLIHLRWERNIGVNKLAGLGYSCSYDIISSKDHLIDILTLLENDCNEVLLYKAVSSFAPKKKKNPNQKFKGVTL